MTRSRVGVVGASAAIVLVLGGCAGGAGDRGAGARTRSGSVASSAAQVASDTLVVMLGTGNPNPDPEHWGPAVAVVAGNRPYLVDCGSGVVRRAAAAYEQGVDALEATRLDRLFVTHLHSDHTVGYADLIITPWIMGREQPLIVYGPPGIAAMTDHLLAAYAEDRRVRLFGSQPQNATGIAVDVHEIEPGIVYRDDNVTVTAFAVPHGVWEHAFGFRFDTPAGAVVVSGDTTPSGAVVTACNGCDVLVHEVYARAGWDLRPPDWQAYHSASHTSGVELGELAVQARPRLLVLTHQLLWGATEAQLLAEVRQHFQGQVVSANDLDVFQVSPPPRP